MPESPVQYAPETSIFTIDGGLQIDGTNLHKEGSKASPYTVAWTLDDATQGVQIFGGTGSGKTSGSGQTIARCYLSRGFGGLVLCAKNDEAARWETWAKQEGREDDLIIFSANSKRYPYAFNFLNYEATRKDDGGGSTYNIAEIFLHLNTLGKSGSGSNEAFWQNALRELLVNTIDLILLSKTELTIEAMSSIILVSTQSDLTYSPSRQGREFNKRLEALKTLAASDTEDVNTRITAQKTHLYWTETFQGLDERTRSNIVQSFTGIAVNLGRGILAPLFSPLENMGRTKLIPDVSLDGKIIVLDLSVHSYGDAGRYAQVLFKYMWQKAVERRPKSPRVEENANLRPVFLWVDESQLFLTQYDMVFQTTARSSRVCTVYLTQNISNYYAVMPANRSKVSTDALLGNLGTKIFHANDDPATNQWAANLIGKDFKAMTTQGRNWGGSFKDPSLSSSESIQHQWHYIVPPNQFRALKRGGKKNHLQVQGIIMMPAQNFGSDSAKPDQNTSRPYAVRIFYQNLNPTRTTHA